jgi:hypothetical protein
VRLREKGGKQHEMPAHHLIEHYLAAYVTAAGIGTDKASPLFRTLGGRGCKQLSGARMARQMILRRALAAGIITSIGCHTMAAYVAEDAGQADPANVLKRYWKPSRSVIHLAAAAAIVGQQLVKRQITPGLEIYFLDRACGFRRSRPPIPIGSRPPIPI